jgi:hypothetical protein
MRVRSETTQIVHIHRRNDATSSKVSDCHEKGIHCEFRATSHCTQ